MNYVAVYVVSGLADGIRISEHFGLLRDEMIQTAEDNFNRDTDDFKIFNEENCCVWSYEVNYLDGEE